MALVFVRKESEPGETRVAATPETVKSYVKHGLDVAVESGAGLAAGFPDAEYDEAGASLRDALGEADLVLSVRTPPNDAIAAMKADAMLVSSLVPAFQEDAVNALAQAKVTAFAMESVPRITRAQKMDVLSSQATCAGYQAVLMAAVALPNMFPLLMTAAGTIRPAKVFVLGAGVAGLQAIATAKRLGAQVEANDVRPAVKEQVESLGAKFVDTGTPPDAETAGGYAKEASEEYPGEAARDPDQARRRERRGHHDRAGAGAQGAAHRHRGHGEADAAGLGDRRPRGRDRRQRRGDHARRHGEGRRCDDPRRDESACAARRRREPHVGTQRRELPRSVPEGRSPRAVVRRRDRPCDVHHEGWRDPERERPEATGEGRAAGCAGRLEDGRERQRVLGRSILIATLLFIFVLASFVGFEIITKVPPTLHTPLMSGSNAISGITIVGAILAMKSSEPTLAQILGFVAVVFAMINVVGGFLVTDRMLGMFGKKKAKKD